MRELASLKLRHFRDRHNVYYVGIDGIFLPDADSLFIRQYFIKKMIQIKTYCRKYDKTVCVLVNTTVAPNYLIESLKSLNLKIQSVLKNASEDTIYGNYFVRENPTAFLAKHCEVLFVVKPDGDDVEFEVDSDKVAIHTIVYRKAHVVHPRIDDPMLPVADHEQKSTDNNSPYYMFDLLKQGRERVVDNYYDRVTKAPEPSPGPAPLRMKNQQK